MPPYGAVLLTTEKNLLFPRFLREIIFQFSTFNHQIKMQPYGAVLLTTEKNLRFLRFLREIYISIFNFQPSNKNAALRGCFTDH